jgi:hypothetical protein
VWAKNMPRRLLLRYWPAMLRAQLGFTLHSLYHFREPAARARLRGQWASVIALPHFLRKRSRLAAQQSQAALLTS